jgi:hypothetical protein
MSIIQEGIKQTLHSLRPLSQAGDTVSAKSGAGKKNGSVNVDRSGWVEVSVNHLAFSEIESNSSFLNDVAQKIRTTDSGMNKIISYLDEMKAQLEKIVKNYPPFPADSEDRKKLLTSFTSLRRQIEQLTLPHAETDSTQQAANDGINSNSGDWSLTIQDQASVEAVPGEIWQTVTDELDIPDLFANASDEQVYQVMADLDNAKAEVTQRKGNLAVEAEGLKRVQEQNSRFARFYRSFGERLGSTGTMEISADIKSVDVKYALTNNSINSLTQAQSQLISLLR